MSTERDYFLCTRRDERHQIEYYDIRVIRIEKGRIWDSLSVNTESISIDLQGLSANMAESLSHDIESRVKQIIIGHVLENKKALAEVESLTNALLNSNRYHSQTDIQTWVNQFPFIGQDLSHPYFDPSLLPKKIQTTLISFQRVKQPGSRLIIEKNEQSINYAIEKYSPLFLQLEDYPLSTEQMRAVIINEDRNLLIAAAGSGKTSTIVAKAIYLVCAGLAKPEEILILAYNKDAQVEIENRLKELVGVASEYKAPIKAKTFHSFGFEILSASKARKPSISKFSTAGKQQQSRLFSELIKELYENDSKFMSAWRNFLLVGKYSTPDVFEIKSLTDYNDYLIELGAIRRKTPEGISLMIPTIDGKEVRSIEEARIANWLALRGVNYEYERAYVNPNNPDERIKYHPDFYYPEGDLYHEHFAINSQGETPPFIGDNYLVEMAWKRETHGENNTTLIETHSAHFKDGTIFDLLEQLLLKNNVPFNPLSKAEADLLLSKAFTPEVDTALFISFLHHFKANNSTLELIKKKANDLTDPVRVSLFLELFESIYNAYTKRLEQANEIDFEDQINRACDQLESNAYQHSFKYILVDEFQDTSQDRKRMILALLDQDEKGKLFAVGDDWQSIYRFAGVDIQIMTHFTEHFGVTSQNYLTQTYRSYRGIVDVAATFVQHNDAQIKKQVSTIKHIEKEQVNIYGYENETDQANQLKYLLSKLNSLPSDNKLSVFLLARYKHLEPKKLGKFFNLKIKFSTIHASKGLEADYVILLNVETGTYGFPSSIADDPLMQLVIPRPETYPHAEERRLMYVAITRAKRGIFIFSSQRKPSPFVAELAAIQGVKAHSIQLERTHPCPDCDTGELSRRVGRFGAFYGCSNYPECEYTAPVICPQCNVGKLVKRESKNGPFISCSTFPNCKYSEKY